MTSKTKTETKLSVVATRCETVAEHLDSLQALGADPEIVSVVPAALAELCRHMDHDVDRLLFLGERRATLVLCKDNALYSSHTVAAGVQSLSEALAQDLKISVAEARSKLLEDLDFAEGDDADLPFFSEALDSYGKALKRLLMANNKEEETSTYVLGDLSTTRQLEKLQNAASEVLTAPTPHTQLGVDSPTLQRYAIAIGLGLGGFASEEQSINLRRKSLAHPQRWRRLRQQATRYFAICAGVALLLFGVSQLSLHRQQKKLHRDYEVLLSLEEKGPEGFEKEFSRKFRSTVTSRNLSADDILARVKFLEKQSRQKADPFPLLPGTPRLSDVLAWLSTHPVAGAKENSGHFRIESLHYSVVSRPQKNSPRDRYQAKVTLEFTTETPRVAREFHDALLADSSILDSKQGVSWTTSRGRYRSTFYLMDKTYYPSR